MRLAGRGLWRGGMALCGVLLLSVLALAAGALWLQREVPNHRPEVVEWLEQSLGVVVALDTMTLHWTWHGPEVALSGVSVRAIDQQAPIALEEVRVGFSFLDLVSGRIQLPNRLEIRQADVRIERRENGQWLIQGIVLDREAGEAGPAWRAAIPVLERLGEITLRDSTIVFVMAGREEPIQRFSGVDLRLSSHEQVHRVSVSSHSAAMLGRDFSLVLDARGPLAEPQKWVIGIEAGLTEALPKDYLDPWLGRWLDLHRSRLSLDFTGHWDPAGESRFELLADAQDLILPATDHHDRSHLDRLAGRFTWRGTVQDWALNLVDVQVALDGRPWPAVQGTLVVQRPEAVGQTAVSGSLSTLRLQDAQRLWMALPLIWRQELSGEQLTAWSQNPVTGDLRDLAFAVQREADGTWNENHLAGRFENLGWSALGVIPGMSGLTGSLRADQDGGWLRVAGDAVGFQYPDLFTKTWPKGKLESELRWERDGPLWKLWSPEMRLEHPDLAAQGTLALAWRDGQRPAIDLQVDFQKGNAAALDRYLPRRFLPPATARWLRSAILDGHIRDGRLRLRGDLERFPFRDGGGIFEVKAHVEEGVVRFNPDWPAFEAVSADLGFTGSGFEVTVQSARSHGLTLTRSRLEMADYREPLLIANGEGVGDHQAALDYLSHAPPGRSVKVLLDGARGQGPVHLALSLRLPLRNIRETQVSGLVRWDGARLEKPEWRVGLSNIRGSLRFREDRLEATNIQALLDGEPVNLQVSALDERLSSSGFHATRIQLGGRLPASVLRRQLTVVDPRTIQGVTTFDARLDVLPGGRLQWSGRSSLDGMTLDWPPPLAKGSAMERALVVEGSGDGVQHLIQFDQAGGLLQGTLRLVNRDRGWEFDRGLIGLNQPVRRLPDRSGLWIRGKLDRVSFQDLAAWQSVWAPRKVTVNQSWALPAWLGGLDVAFGVAQWGALQQSDVRVALNRGDGQTPSLHVQSPALDGVFRPALGDNAVRVDLKWFDLDAFGGAGAASPQARAAPTRSTVDPRKLPAMEIRIARLRYHGSDLGRADMQLQPGPDGITVPRWGLEGSAIRINGSGAWSQRASGAQSSLRFRVESADLPTLARRFGYPDAMEARSARLDANLTWMGAPWEMSPTQALGDFQLEAKEGAIYFRETRPTTGILMSLTGLYDLPRRLTRDFSGVFRPSLPFDEIRGDLHLEKGVVETRRLELKGSAADVRMSGTSDLIRRRFDQEVVVVPSLSAGLALAATVAGGPVAGAVVFMGRELWRRPVSRLVQIRYRFEGDFDSATLEREQGPFNLPETGQP